MYTAAYIFTEGFMRLYGRRLCTRTWCASDHFCCTVMVFTKHRLWQM